MSTEVLLATFTSVASVIGVLAATYFAIKVSRDQPKEESRIYEELRSAPRPQGDSDEKRFLLLAQYHSASLSQSKTSFWFSLIFAAIGFLVIIMPVVRNTGDVQVVNLVSGAVIEAVAGLFFVQSNRARKLMVEFFDRLRADRKLENALEMANRTDDEVLRAKLKALIALEFAGIRANPDENVLAAALKQDGFLATLLDLKIPERAPRATSPGSRYDASDSPAQPAGQPNGVEKLDAT